MALLVGHGRSSPVRNREYADLRRSTWEPIMWAHIYRPILRRCILQRTPPQQPRVESENHSIDGRSPSGA